MRTKYCNHISITDINTTVILCGWVNRVRNFGNFIFVDLRDCSGIIQIFFHSKNSSVFKKAMQLKNEFCIQIVGVVQSRSKKNENKKLNTGLLEIVAKKLKIFNVSKKLPIDFNNIYEDVIKLKYRYLDLRCLNMLQKFKIRHEITYYIHQYMHKNNFLNIETPILTKSTPSGAKDYLIESRLHKKKYYALSQSPQLFKQLLMIAGFDRYYQIVKCFRDEDLRSDRQPEFTQVDFEVSFVNEIKIMEITEKLITEIWKNFLNISLKKFSVLSFSESIKKYGSDKPDLRNPMELIDLPHSFFKYFNYNNIQNYDIKIRTTTLLIKNGIIKLKDHNIQSYNHIIQKNNDILYIYIYIQDISLKKYKIINIKNLLNAKTINEIVHRTNAKNGDIILIISGEYNTINKLCNILREKIGYDTNLIQKIWKPTWIIDFPMFKKNKDGSFSAIHHPFTAPKNCNITDLKNNPSSVLSNSYDLVMNGYEIGGGSVRIHDVLMQKTIFEILNLTYSSNMDALNFFINALEYGTPPHAGIALGLDRIIMLLTNSTNIKDVIAFPKTNTATCLMSNAPNKFIY